MFDIFKLNYIVKDEIKKIYVFFGSRKLQDGENKVEPNQLYHIEPENPLFKNIFSEDELKNIEENKITIELLYFKLKLVKIIIFIDKIKMVIGVIKTVGEKQLIVIVMVN